jgi:hypothetical protein
MKPLSPPWGNLSLTLTQFYDRPGSRAALSAMFVHRRTRMAMSFPSAIAFLPFGPLPVGAIKTSEAIQGSTLIVAQRRFRHFGDRSVGTPMEHRRVDFP